MNAVRHGVESPLGADAAERAEFAAQIISDNGGHIANTRRTWRTTTPQPPRMTDCDSTTPSRRCTEGGAPSWTEGPLGTLRAGTLTRSTSGSTTLSGTSRRPVPSRAQTIIQELTPALSEKTRILEKFGEGGTATPSIPGAATPTKNSPDAWKPSVAHAPSSRSKASPRRPGAVDALQAKGVPWKDANKYSPEQWQQLHRKPGSKRPSPPCLRDVRKSAAACRGDRAAASESRGSA